MHFMRCNSTFFLLVVLTFLLSACDSKEERKIKYFSQGVEFFEANNFEKSRVSFKNVLQLDPDDVESRVYYGKLMENDENYRQAVGHYNRVLELQPNHFEASIRLGKLMLLFGYFDRAMELGSEAVVSHPDEPDSYTLKGSVLGKLEKYSEGIDYAKKALSIDPNFIEAKILMGTLLAKDKQFSLAEESLNKSIKEHPDQAAFYTLLAAVNQEVGNSEKTWNALKKVAELNSDDYSQIEIVINFLKAQQWYDRAEILLRDFISSNQTHVQSRLSLVNIFVDMGNKDNAFSTLNDYVNEFPETYEYQFALSQLHLVDGQEDKAVEILNNIIADQSLHPSAFKARNRLAAFYIDKKEYDKALGFVNQVLEENTSDLDALTLRGAIYLAQRDVVNAIADLRTVVKERPLVLRLYKMLAQAHILGKENSLAVDYLRKASKLFPNDRSLHIQLAELLVQTGERLEAITLYEKLLAESVEDSQLIDQLIKLYFAEKQIKSASQLVEVLAQNKAAVPRADYYRGIILQNKGDHSAALVAFDRSIVAVPQAIEPISAKVKSLLALERVDDAHAWLLKKIEEAPKNVILHNLAGEVNITQKEFTKAKVQFEQAIKKQPDWWMPYRRLANVSIQLQDLERAIEVLEEGIRSTKGNIVLYNELAAIYERQGRIEEAISEFEKALRSSSENESVINNLAMMLVNYRSDQASLDRAKQLAGRLRESKNPYFLDTAGWVYYKRGEYDLALPMIKRAVDQVGIPSMHYHLGMAYYQLNEIGRAKKHLEISMDEKGSFPGKTEAGLYLDKIKQS